MNNKKRFSTLKVGGLILGSGLMMSTLLGCATHRATNRAAHSNEARKMARLESRLRQAQLQIETLREHNWVLRNRIKIVQENGGVDPQTAPEPLAAFSGTQLDVPISPTRQNVALTPRRQRAKSLPPKVRSVAQAPKEKGEQADKVLVRTVIDLLKVGDEAEANRTAALLEKSYPESECVSEARFQQGLFYFRKKNLTQADRFFQTTLELPRAHVRARAGASLMRGIIARRLAVASLESGRNSPAAQANLGLAKRSFEYVRKQFPKSPEARRAGRELKSMTAFARAGNVSRIQ